jgi:hypothetical protein
MLSTIANDKRAVRHEAQKKRQKEKQKTKERETSIFAEEHKEERKRKIISGALTSAQRDKKRQR